MTSSSWTIGVALSAWAAAVVILTLVSYGEVRALHARGAADPQSTQSTQSTQSSDLAGRMSGARVRVARVEGALALLDLTDPTTRSVHAAATAGRALAWMVDGAWWGVTRVEGASDGWVRLGAPPPEVTSWPITGRVSTTPPPAGEWHVFVFHRRA